MATEAPITARSFFLDINMDPRAALAALPVVAAAWAIYYVLGGSRD